MESKATLEFAIKLLKEMQPKKLDLMLRSNLNEDLIDFGEQKQQNREHLVYQRQIDELTEKLAQIKPRSEKFVKGNKYKSKVNKIALGCEYEIIEKMKTYCTARLWENGKPTITTYKKVPYSALIL